MNLFTQSDRERDRKNKGITHFVKNHFVKNHKVDQKISF
jgi:hypothetical protein